LGGVQAGPGREHHVRYPDLEDAAVGDHDHQPFLPCLEVPPDLLGPPPQVIQVLLIRIMAVGLVGDRQGGMLDRPRTTTLGGWPPLEAWLHSYRLQELFDQADPPLSCPAAAPTGSGVWAPTRANGGRLRVSLELPPLDPLTRSTYLALAAPRLARCRPPAAG
jgi:hypothetical protein